MNGLQSFASALPQFSNSPAELLCAYLCLFRGLAWLTIFYNCCFPVNTAWLSDLVRAQCLLPCCIYRENKPELTNPTRVFLFPSRGVPPLQVEAEAEEWTALGFSPDGGMVGSDAVIFLPELDDVSEHILGSQVRDGPSCGCWEPIGQVLASHVDCRS